MQAKLEASGVHTRLVYEAAWHITWRYPQRPRSKHSRSFLAAFSPSLTAQIMVVGLFVGLVSLLLRVSELIMSHREGMSPCWRIFYCLQRDTLRQKTEGGLKSAATLKRIRVFKPAYWGGSGINASGAALPGRLNGMQVLTCDATLGDLCQALA